MTEIFTQYAAYNLWANSEFAEVVRGITPSYFDREIESSFPSIRETINHIRAAEYIWLKRLKGKSEPWPQYPEGETSHYVADAWVQGSQALLAQINQLTDADVGTELTYTDIKGNVHSDLLSHILMHLFNHSSYHRGQLVTLLRQSGITKIPRSDYIVYARNLKAI